MRIDRLLHHLRFVKSRGLAQAWIAQGHIRRNGRRVLDRDLPVNAGDVLTLPMGRTVRVIEILALPQRRGPASEAQEHYRDLDAGGLIAIAGAEGVRTGGEEGNAQP